MDAGQHYIRQAAAIPVRGGEVCLVTSNNGKRWVIPKGIIDPGHTAGECALVEAWEEAGLVGTLSREPVGSYVYEKWGGTCHVTVFVMDVTEAAEEWPERAARERRWLRAVEVTDWIDDRGLREVVRAAVGKGK
ncbi:MAG: NUDIX hydrolase [Gemmataceae bacterium]|nr:NUDIX hydrolase [Gemmataceae bacterium]